MTHKQEHYEDWERELLSRDRAKVRSVVEGLKIPSPDCFCDQNKEVCEKCAGRYQREAHNAALDTLLHALEDVT